MTTQATTEERLVRLETGYEHLATKADVADLRAEMQTSIANLMAEIQKRDAESKARDVEIMNLIAGINANFEALRREMAASNEALRREMVASNEALQREMAASNEALQREMAASNEALRREMTASNEALRREMAGSDEAIRAEIRAVSAKAEAVNAETKSDLFRWVIGTLLGAAAVTGAVTVAFQRIFA